MKAHAEQVTCGGCGAAMTDQAFLCLDCTDEAAAMLRRLTSVVIRSDREPATRMLTIRQLDGTTREVDVIVPGDCGRRVSTRWDTPSGEVANLPRMLNEQSARLAVRTTQARLRTMRVDPPLPVDLRAGRDSHKLGAIVLGAIHALTGRRPPVDDQAIEAGARWLADQLPAVRLLDWSPGLLAGLKRAVERAERHVDRPPARSYLGPCDQRTYDAAGHDLGPCAGEYLAGEDDVRAACTGCRAEVDAAARKRALLDSAADRWMTARQIEDLTVCLGFARVADSTVESWGARGQVRRQRIAAVGVDGEGPMHFLLGDVLARLEAGRQRRTA